MKLEECELDEDGKCRLDDIFASEDLHPGDLKAALEEFIETHLRSRLARNLPDVKTLNALIDEAFPVPNKKGKKQANQSPKVKEVAREGKYYRNFYVMVCIFWFRWNAQEFI